MTGKLPKRTRPRLGNCPPSNAELVKSNRIRRRAHDRAEGLAKQAPRKPPVPVVTFFLDKIKAEVRNHLMKIEGPDAYGAKSFHFVNCPVVYIRDIIEQHKRVKGRWVELPPKYSKWRVFPYAEPLLPEDDVHSLAQFIGIKAPLTAWAATGMLDGLVLRDLPKEARQGRFDRPGETTKRAA